MTQTNNGNIRYEASTGNVILGELKAGTAKVAVIATAGSIIDGDSAVDIIAAEVRMTAGFGIGNASDPLELTVNTISAFAGPGGMALASTGAVTVGSVDIIARRVIANGGDELVYDVIQSGLHTDNAGFIVLHAGGTVTVVPGKASAVLFPDSAEEITLVADEGGTAFNGYVISLENDSTIAGDDAIASYNSDTKTLTVKVRSEQTTAGTLVTEINAVDDLPFTAMSTGPAGDALVVTVGASGLDYSSRNGTDDTVISEISTVTDGGDEALPASAVLLPPTIGFGIKVTSETAGADTNGITVRLLDDGAGGYLADGTDTAAVVYDDVNRRLNIFINNGFTTVGAVVDEINAADLPFAAAIEGNGDGTVVLHTAPVATVVNVPARVSLAPPGAKNDMIITAAAAGTPV